MKTKTHIALQHVKNLAVMLSLSFATAHADEYSDVSQMARSGRSAEALARAEQFLAKNPKDAQMRFVKGVVLGESGRTAEAITTFVRLTEEFPELPEPYNNLAVLYASQNQIDKARVALEAAIRTNPSYSVAHENLGDVYAKLASQAYNKALQLNPPNPAVAPKLSLIRELYSTNPNRAQKAAGQVTGTSPNTVSAAASAPAQITTATKPAVVATPPTPVATSTPAASAAKPIAPGPVAAASAPAHAAVNSATNAAAQAAHADQKDIEAAVHAWANAWASKDMKGYLGAYDKTFVPPGAMSRSAWENERKDRITGKASISVKISAIEVKVAGTKAVAKFRQDYKAGELASSTRKTLEMQKSGDRWKIIREAVGA